MLPIYLAEASHKPSVYLCSYNPTLWRYNLLQIKNLLFVEQVLILLLAIVYLAIAVLAGIAVWAGIDNHQSYNNGQVKIDLDKYKVTRVSESSLGLRCVLANCQDSMLRCSILLLSMTETRQQIEYLAAKSYLSLISMYTFSCLLPA